MKVSSELCDGPVKVGRLSIVYVFSVSCTGLILWCSLFVSFLPRKFCFYTFFLVPCGGIMKQVSRVSQRADSALVTLDATASQIRDEIACPCAYGGGVCAAADAAATAASKH